MIDIKDKEVFFQVIDATALSGSLAGQVQETSIQLNRDYNRIIGIGYFEIDDANVTDNYLVGARTNRKTWIEDININAWDANQNVGPMGKYYEVNIPYGSGDTFYARQTPGATLSSDLTGQMVLILCRDLVEINK